MRENHTTSINVFLMHALPRPKIGQPNLDFHQFSYSERLIHSKRHLKCLCIEVEENRQSHLLLRESLSKPKIGLTNVDFHEIFCSKRL